MGDNSTTGSTGILALWNDCKTNKDSLYETWYQSEHLQDRVNIPGFKLGRRHESNGVTPKYFTYYETSSVDVLYSDAYLYQLDNPSQLTQEVMQGTFINVSRTVCSRIHCVGEMRGSYVVTARSGMPTNQDELKTIAEHLNSLTGCLRSEVWLRYSLDSTRAENNPRREEQMRGQDSRIEWCVIAHAINELIAEHATREFQQFPYPNLQLGIYRFMCELRHED